jgi:mono/diheme cytochrome c family protein
MPTSPTTKNTEGTLSESTAAASPTPEDQLAAGKQLYASYCASCHGDDGDGNGLAARFVHPKPRNFRDGKFRLVTTVNRVPSDDDLMYVIDRGMPGSAMFPFAHLSESDRRALVAYVRHLTRSGLEDRFRKLAEEANETVDPVELANDLDRMTKPGAAMSMPARWPTADGKSVERGREVYMQQCASCHGNTGKGDGVQEQRDDDGTPTSPRDYTRGIFKGGRERDQLYARILLGMPGTPMPSSSNLQPEQISDIVHFIQSLADPFAQSEVAHKRTRLVAKRSEPLAEEIPDAVWESSRPTHITISPLWWRNYDEPALGVQALHDGRSLAIRLTWRDATRNEHAIRTQDFEDQIAVQLFKGPREPFLGMGSSDGQVDLWVWNAGWQADLAEHADVDTQYPNMFVDEYQLEEKEDGNSDRQRPHATTRQNRTFLTGLAAGNLRSDPTRGTAASANQAKGFGTLTMLPRPSQIVTAKGSWSDGRWSVVLRRQLEVGADAGIQLTAAERLSIALAIWDGAARDRDGQKLVSIWHDLELER